MRQRVGGMVGRWIAIVAMAAVALVATVGQAAPPTLGTNPGKEVTLLAPESRRGEVTKLRWSEKRRTGGYSPGW